MIFEWLDYVWHTSIRKMYAGSSFGQYRHLSRLRRASEIICKARERRSHYSSDWDEPRVGQFPNRKIPKVSVIAWDVGHNPLGRAYLLAEVLMRRFEVEVIGASFPRFGGSLWKPLRGCSRVSIKAIRGRDFPLYFKDMEKIAQTINGDILYVSKPRLPSLELAILAKIHRNRPIILDIDDYEPSFFLTRDPLTLEEVQRLQHETSFKQPWGEIWTRFCESLVPLCDELTVSNIQLQRRYGGTIVPHARDERDFDPDAWPRDAIRNALGITPEDKVIVFAGTPRIHKGLATIITALQRVRRHSCKLLIVGSAADSGSRKLLESANPTSILSVPDVPFSHLPGYLCAGDLVCLPQSIQEAVSLFQIPAKLTDALALGIPILASGVPPILPLAEDGLVEILDTVPEHQIEAIFDDYPRRKQQAEANRVTFLQKFSHSAVLPCLSNLIDSLLARPAPVPTMFYDLINFHSHIFQGEESRTSLRLLETGQSGQP